MRPALLTPAYWPEVRRGTERMVHDLAAGLAARGQDPAIVTAHPGRPRSGREDGALVVRLPRPRGRVSGRLGFPPHTAHAPLELAAVAALRPDVAHAFHPGDATAAVAWGRVRRRPSVFSIMGVPRAAGLRSHRRSWELWQAAVRATAVVTLSEAAARAARTELGVQDARVIYPGVDVSNFTPDGPRDDVPTIVCAAAMEDARKRVPLLLDAFAVLRERQPDARLLLNRPGDPALAAQAERPGVELVDPRAAGGGFRRMYSRAWVSALASEAEAFGLVLVEALACGTPVVGGSDGGVAEIVDTPSVGRLFDVHEPDAVAAALHEALELAADPATAAACRARAEDFSTARMVDAHLELYRDLGVAA